MEITENTLMTKNFMGTLRIEDEYYKIVVRYVGNYAEDIKKKLDVGYLSASVKMKKVLFPLEIYFREKEIMIESNIFFIHEDKIDKAIEMLQIAKKEIVEIKKYLEEYFFSYYEKEDL